MKIYAVRHAKTSRYIVSFDLDQRVTQLHEATHYFQRCHRGPGKERIFIFTSRTLTFRLFYMF